MGQLITHLSQCVCVYNGASSKNWIAFGIHCYRQKSDYTQFDASGKCFPVYLQYRLVHLITITFYTCRMQNQTELSRTLCNFEELVHFVTNCLSMISLPRLSPVLCNVCFSIAITSWFSARLLEVNEWMALIPMYAINCDVLDTWLNA